MQETGSTPLITTPMHPEYPCAHCVSASPLGAVIEAEIGGNPMPTLSTSSPTAGGVTRTWKSVPDLVDEVKLAHLRWGALSQFGSGRQRPGSESRQTGSGEVLANLLVSAAPSQEHHREGRRRATHS